MSCLSDGTLRAKIDDELGEPEAFEVDQHLAACMKCRERLEQISLSAREANEALDALRPREEPNFRQAWARLEARREEERARKPRGFSFFSRHPAPAWGATVLGVLIVVLVSFAPARSVAQRVLAMLRVERVTVVPVNLPVNPGPNTLATIRSLLSDRVVETLSSGKPQIATSAAQASQLAGFQVRVLQDGANAPQFSVAGEKAFVMTLDKSRLQEIVNDLGHQDLQIPDSVDGKTIAVHIPKTVFEKYGNCPVRGRRTEGPPNSPPSAGSGHCVLLIQAPSPIVSVPPDLNVSQLAEIALESTGMSPQEAEAFSQTVDWTSTLVIPIPQQASSSHKEEVDGVQGTLISHTSRNGAASHYSLIWVKNGIIYSIIGSGDPGNAVALANSMS
ncbi:MAG TPA: hypothetical protein VFZ08_12385 [Terriglobia bacterium]|nr:hypothetical protein [Terriglobia bacterium]